MSLETAPNGKIVKHAKITTEVDSWTEESLKKLSVDSLKHMVMERKIPTSGLTRKKQMIQALLTGSNTAATKALRHEAKPAPKRVRQTKSLRQKASAQGLNFHFGLKFNLVPYEEYDQFFIEHEGKFYTREYPAYMLSAGEEMVAPFVTIVGESRDIIISKFPLHIWRDYFLPGFEDTIESYTIKKDGYIPGQFFLVSNIPSTCHSGVRMLFQSMADAKLDGIPFAIEHEGTFDWGNPIHRAASSFGLSHYLPAPEFSSSAASRPFFSAEDFANLVEREPYEQQMEITPASPLFSDFLPMNADNTFMDVSIQPGNNQFSFDIDSASANHFAFARMPQGDEPVLELAQVENENRSFSDAIPSGGLELGSMSQGHEPLFELAPVENKNVLDESHNTFDENQNIFDVNPADDLDFGAMSQDTESLFGITPLEN